MKNLVKLSLLFILIACFSCNTPTLNTPSNFYKSLHFLNQKNDSLSIENVIDLYDKNQFNIPFENKVFYDLKNKETSWIHFKINPQKENFYFLIWNPFLEYGKIYTRSDTLKELQTFSLLDKNLLNWKYRIPTWKIAKSNFETDVFLKIKDNREKTTLKFLLLSEYNYHLFSQIDYAVIALQIGVLLVLIVIAIFLFSGKRKKAIFWYALYVAFCIIEFILYKGLDLQYNFAYSPVFQISKRILFQALSITSMMFFFINFYPFVKRTQFIKKIYLIIAYLGLVISCIFIFEYTQNKIYINKVYLYSILRICALFILGSHLYLIIKKVLPIYLGVAFLLPISGFFIFYVFGEPKQTISLTGSFLVDNIYPVMITIEMSFILYYIIRQFVKSEFLAIKLSNENLELRNSFQDNILKIEHEEKNKLVSDVHDTFGGYIEALKLRLLQNNKNTPEKIQQILDAFNRDYRYLLNSLYAPKINSNNFIENLVEFCSKIDGLTEQKITHNFRLDNSSLSQQDCLHLYRIISELTTNAIKHSKANEIKISIYQNKNDIVLELKDDGVGFTENNKKGFGLNNVKTRIAQMNGNLAIDSNSNGTSIYITIPTKRV
ncbi:sensor histidine kinase [Polaribacter aestuariivivens]|uniref:sensor histidine kinase n=1 Tax=Polaribacter aestuariivivens TaxID=2304626 RepID=UPI003F496EA0